MALWRIRTDDGTREGLTVYQLQELVRAGHASANDEVASDDDEAWRRVADVPVLARLLPALDDATDTPPRTVVVAGLTLEIGPDGRPLPPRPDQIAQALAGTRDDSGESMKRAGKVMSVLAALIFLLAGVVLLQIVLAFRG